MNRETRRKLTKEVKKRGLSDVQAKAYVEVVNRADEIRKNGASATTPEKHFEDGDKVMINIDAIKARQNYEHMSENYKQFVENSAGVVYTAHIEQQKLVSFEEEPRWLFWSGDLIGEKETLPEMVARYKELGGNGEAEQGAQNVNMECVC